MSSYSHTTNLPLQVIINCRSSKENIRNPSTPNKEELQSCYLCSQGNTKPKLICTEPIPMRMTCIKKCARDQGPIGRITRNQDFDIVGSKYVYRCNCGVRNGLDPECKRISCQNNPACLMNPPRCWPKYRPHPDERKEIEVPIRLCYYLD